ncbi:MAG TPA: GNAT family N-acetyltransferase [Firmicutes bacterium]|nr:GNAT family N-acetyltransferase [Bacillota bacterium]
MTGRNSGISEKNTACIRDLTENDLLAAAEFEARIAAISFGEEAVTDPQEHLKKLKRALAKGEDIMLVLEEGRKVHGWLWISINTNMFTGDRYANFRSFALSPTYQGGEWGELLFQAGLARVVAHQDVKKVVGRVHMHNLPMRILYKKLGFQPVHITMELSLAKQTGREGVQPSANR